MNILIATPLFPPDIEPSAMYVQELAKRLADTYSVSVLTYGALPEPTENVTVYGVGKNELMPVRLTRFFFTLLKEVRKTDVVIFENGPSVELPVLLVSLFSLNTRFIFHEGDRRALKALRRQPIRALLHRLVRMRAKCTLNETPPEKPEILPLSSVHVPDVMMSYDAVWDLHLKEVRDCIT